jgi:hypothetical protein
VFVHLLNKIVEDCGSVNQLVFLRDLFIELLEILHVAVEPVLCCGAVD